MLPIPTRRVDLRAKGKLPLSLRGLRGIIDFDCSEGNENTCGHSHSWLYLAHNYGINPYTCVVSGNACRAPNSTVQS
jgi:hypothetical protein